MSSSQTSNLVDAARELLRLKDLKTDAERIETSGSWDAVHRRDAMLAEYRAKKGEAWDALRRALHGETRAPHPTAVALRELADSHEAQGFNDTIGFTPTALRRFADQIDAVRTAETEGKSFAGPTWQCFECGTVDDFSAQHEELPQEGNRVVTMIECSVCGFKCTDARSETREQVKANCQQEGASREAPSKEPM